MKGRWLVGAIISLFLGTSHRGVAQNAGAAPALSAPASPEHRPIRTPPAPKPDPRAELNNAAIRLSRENNNGAALSLLDRAGALRPSDTLTYNRALVLIKLKRYEEARALLTSLPAFAHAQANRGYLLARTGQQSAALDLLQSAPASAGWVNAKAVNTALAYYGQGRYEEARRGLEAAGSIPAARLLRGDLALLQGEYAGALTAYQSLADDATYGRRAAVRLGNALLGLRRFAEAARQFEEYLTGNDRSERAYARLGLANALYGQRLYDRALAEYRLAVQLLPQVAEARIGLGNTFLSKKDYRSARAQYETALKTQPGKYAAQLGLGVVAYRQNELPTAIGHMDKVDKLLDPADPDQADAFLHRGLAALGQSRYDTARRALETAVRLRPDDPAAFLALSEVFRRQDLYGQSLERLMQALDKLAGQGLNGPQAPDPGPSKGRETSSPGLQRARGRMLANRGSLLLKLGLMDQAQPVFSEALQDDPGNTNALNGLAVILLEKDQLNKASALYDSLIGRGTRHAFLYNNRGIVRAYAAMQLDRNGQSADATQLYGRALADTDKAQQLDSNRLFYQNNRANSLKNREQYDEAIKSYQAYLSKSAINNLGVLYAVKGNAAFARYYLNLAIELDSANLVYQFNRLKLYQTHFPDSIARKPSLQAAAGRLPANSISTRYSRDGYINIYLYDYAFDPYEYPANHHFPLPIAPPAPPEMLLIDDFVPLPEAPAAPAAPPAPAAAPTTFAPAGGSQTRPDATPQVTRSTSGRRSRMPRPARPRRMNRWGSTRCPRL